MDPYTKKREKKEKGRMLFDNGRARKPYSSKSSEEAKLPPDQSKYPIINTKEILKIKNPK